MSFIEIEGLVKKYPGRDEPAVRGVSLAIEQGEVMGLLGPNGAGKTTLISMLSCMLPPSEGSAHIAGLELGRDARRIKALLGLVPQDLALYPSLSVRDNLAYFGSLYGLGGYRLKGNVERALAMVALADRASDPVDTLSGGMKRRANLAAALVHEPRVLFLDEPTVGIDPQSRNFIFDGVEALKKDGLTVVYTTHYMEEAERLCDRVAIIDHGSVLTLGAPQDLIEAHGGLVALRVEGEAGPALEAELLAIAGVNQARVVPGRVTLKSAAPSRVLAPALVAISAAGLKVQSLEIREHDLESVFLQLTGRQLRD